MTRYPYEPEVPYSREENTILRDAYRRQWESIAQRRARKIVKLIPMEPQACVKVEFRAPVHERQSFQIADSIKLGYLLVLNLEQCDPAAAQRLLDFMSGVAYTDGYTITQVATSAYLVSPPCVQICDLLAATV